MLKSPHTNLWKRESFENVDKNAALGSLSMPFEITNLPEGAQVLPSLLAPKVKRDEERKYLCELKVRYCAHGDNQIVGYQDVHAPVAQAEFFRIFTSMCAYFLLIILKFNVVNCFQNSVNKVENMVFLVLPPFYIE